MNITIAVDKAGGFLEIRGNPRLAFSDLASTPLRMLERCPSIPRVLPVVATEIDLDVVLRYPLQGLSPLSEVWASGRQSSEDALHCLLEIAKTLEECGQYLLHPDDFLLDPDYVYVGASPSDVGLVCLPLRKDAKHRNSREEFARLVRYLCDRTPAFPDAKRICETIDRAQAPFAEVRRYCALRLQSVAGAHPVKTTAPAPKLPKSVRESAPELPPLETAASRINLKKTWAVAAAGLLGGWWLVTRSETVGYLCLAFAGLCLAVLSAARLRRPRRQPAASELPEPPEPLEQQKQPTEIAFRK